jgi:hypothetical protein
MINLRKMKYVVITDGTSTRYEANVIACSNIYEAQQAYKEACLLYTSPSPRDES